MGKDAHSRLVNGNHTTKQPYSNQRSTQFFNKKETAPPAEVPKRKPRPEVQAPAQEIRLRTTTDFLLAAILDELKMQNTIELMKLKAKQEQEQEELQAAKEMEERDKARFEEIRPSLYM